jgi:tetratricopeptide (TPR) repeat protein
VTNDPLPDSGPEREIFLRALRRFSDACEPPELIAECPFSIDLPGGGRGCGEECLELLDRYGVPPAPGQVPMGTEGMAAQSMGPPRRPSSYPAHRAFDAAENFYRDSDSPDRSRWEASSLLYELRQAYLPKLGMLNPQRFDKLTSAMDELRRRGFDVDALLRLGLGAQLAAALSLAIVIPDLLAAQPPGTGEQGDADEMSQLGAPAGWLKLLDAFMELGRPEDIEPPSGTNDLAVAQHRVIAAITGQFAERLRIWAGTASLDDLINWRPPAIDDFLAYDLGREFELRVESRRQRWLIDRFTETYLSTWDTDSLKLEWRYQQAAEEPPCPPRQMTGRSVDSNDLARALAKATMSPVSDTLSVLVPTAARLLHEGHRGAAAAMFDAARREQEDNADLHNNFGFCLLPDDPAGALKALELASRLGHRRTVNVCNRILALFYMGRYAAALEVAERTIEKWEELDTDSSYLWDFTSPEPKLLDRQCPRCYLVKLAAYIANASGDEVAAARWGDIQRRLGVTQ